MSAESVRYADHQDRPHDGERLVRVLEFALDARDVGKAISLAVVDDKEISALNRRFKEREGPTDVLAFPLEDPDLPDPDPELGEIVISADTAAIQARDEGHSFERELALLALHGLLHLLGFDDHDDNERAFMHEKAEELLAEFERLES